MTRKRIFIVLGVIAAIALTIGTFWYIKTNVKLVTKDDRRALVVNEVSKALERYYNEHGRYPVAESNEGLLRELSAKKYFDTDVRLDVVKYVPVNNGQTYELH